MIFPSLPKTIAAIKNFLRSKMKGVPEPLRDEMPWITFGALEWLRSYLSKNMTAFEWGSGGSTLYLAHRIKKVVSVEHDHQWYHLVRKKIHQDHLTNCDVVLIEPVPTPSPVTISKNPKYSEVDFTSYVHAIDAYPDKYFDLIIIDGRARSACLKEAKNKVKPGGYILLDDSDRTRYQPAVLALGFADSTTFFGPGPYLNFPWGTSVFRRP